MGFFGGEAQRSCTVTGQSLFANAAGGRTASSLEELRALDLVDAVHPWSNQRFTPRVLAAHDVLRHVLHPVRVPTVMLLVERARVGVVERRNGDRGVLVID